MTNKSELSFMGQMKIEAERDFHKFIKYVAELEKENEELKKENKELKAELRKWEQGKYRYFGNDGEQDLYEDVDVIRINEKGQVIDDEGNRYSHTTFHYAN